MRLLLTLLSLIALQADTPGSTLPADATAQLHESLKRSRAAARHVWRDTLPINADGTVNAYIEIPRGDRRKWEFDMARNRRAIDRVMPPRVGGYPVNYGYVPQTVSYDGDPFDALVLGPPLAGGRLVRGTIVGLMQMEDEKGVDSKVVLSLVGRDGRPTHQLTAADRDRIGGYFRRYKLHEPGKFSKVPGWSSPEQGLAFVRMTHRFFRECADSTTAACSLKPVAGD
jgi:inorganic pyrophosphatase